jgi:hypothetical protein
MNPAAMASRKIAQSRNAAILRRVFRGLIFSSL